MATRNWALLDTDVARVLAADSAVGDAFSGLAVSADWKQTAEHIERSTTLDDDPGAVWWARRAAAIGESTVAMMTGRGRSEEVSRRFVDPIIAATLVRGLPELSLQTAVANTRTLLSVRGDEAWQAYRAEVAQVVQTAEDSPAEARRLLAIGDANWQSRDADGPEFLSALTAAGASRQETAWLAVAAAARQEGWDVTRLQSEAYSQRFWTDGLTAPGAAAPSPSVSAPRASSERRASHHSLGGD